MRKQRKRKGAFHRSIHVAVASLAYGFRYTGRALAQAAEFERVKISMSPSISALGDNDEDDWELDMYDDGGKVVRGRAVPTSDEGDDDWVCVEKTDDADEALQPQQRRLYAVVPQGG